MNKPYPMKQLILSLLSSILVLSALAQDCSDDTTAPVFSSFPQNQLLNCGESAGTQEILTATDDCDDLVEVTSTSTLLESNEVCEFTNTTWPNSDEAYALKLFDENNDDTQFELVDMLYNETYALDGSSSILMTGTMKHLDSEGGFIFTVILDGGMTGEEWSNQDFTTSYHDDSGAVNGEHLDWSYYLMNEDSHLEGWGTYDNSELQLTHAPINYFYCFQKGMGANNNVYVPGIGGWFLCNRHHKW